MSSAFGSALSRARRSEFYRPVPPRHQTQAERKVFFSKTLTGVECKLKTSSLHDPNCGRQVSIQVRIETRENSCTTFRSRRSLLTGAMFPEASVASSVERTPAKRGEMNARTERGARKMKRYFAVSLRTAHRVCICLLNSELMLKRTSEERQRAQLARK